MIDWLKKMYRDWQWRRQNEWAQVPPPDWSAKRGGREYW